MYSFSKFSLLLQSPTVSLLWDGDQQLQVFSTCLLLNWPRLCDSGWHVIEEEKRSALFSILSNFPFSTDKFFCFWPARCARYKQDQIDREKRKNCNYFKPFKTGISQQEKQQSIWTDFQSKLGTFNRIFDFRKKFPLLFTTCKRFRYFYSGRQGKTCHPFGCKGNNENDHYACRW